MPLLQETLVVKFFQKLRLPQLRPQNLLLQPLAPTADRDGFGVVRSVLFRVRVFQNGQLVIIKFFKIIKFRIIKVYDAKIFIFLL